jgi:hypothetical protein
MKEMRKIKMKKKDQRHSPAEMNFPVSLFFWFCFQQPANGVFFHFFVQTFLNNLFSVAAVGSIARHSEASMSKQIGSWPAEYSSTGSCSLVRRTTTASAFERA